MKKIYSILDNAFCNSELDISDGATILACNTNGANSHRMCRCTIPLSDTISQYETLTWGSGSLTNGSLGAVYIGIVNASAPTNKYVGEDANGWGFRLDDGKLYNNGSVVATFSACALNDLVYFRVNFDNSQILITILNGSTTIGTYLASTTNTAAWYPAITVAGGTAFSLQTFFNAGQRTFENNTNIDGWWDSIAQPATVYLATSPYLSQSSDSLSSQRFDAVYGALVTDSSMVLPRGAEFWINRGDSRLSTSLSTITLEDPDGTYDFMLDHRNAAMRLNTLDQNGSYDSAQLEDSIILDRVESKGDQSKIIYMADPIAEFLSKPFNTMYFLPNQDISVVDTPVPVLIGMARNFEPVCEDPANHIYRISDSPIGAIGAVRVQGKLLVFGTDYTLSTDGMRITLASAPTGKLTVEASGVVQGIPPGPTDVLGGIGDFGPQTTPTSWQANWKTYYSGNDSYTGSDRPCWRDVFSGSHTPGTDDPGGLSGSNGSILMQLNGPFSSHYGYATGFRTNSNFVQNGKTYAVQITFWDAPCVVVNQPLESTTSTASNFFLDGHHDAHQYYPINGWSGEYYSIYYDVGGKPTSADLAAAGGVCSAVFFNTGLNIQPFTDICPSTITISLTNNTGADLPLGLNFVNGDGGEWWIRTVKMYELPNAINAVPLAGVGLEDYMRAVLTRAGIDEGQWDPIQARAIDAATGYQIGNWFSNQPVTVQQALEPALNTFGASIYRKRDGRMGVVRLIDPDTVADANVNWQIDENEILVEPYVYPDVMQGLTTGAYGRKNYSPASESDFTNMTTTDVPIAERKLLERKYQLTYTSGVQLSEMYVQAQLNLPRESLFDLKSDMQTETERTVAMATVTRKFFQISVKMPPGTQYEVGDVGKVTYKFNNAKTARRYGLNASKVFVYAVDPNPSMQTCLLVCWR